MDWWSLPPWLPPPKVAKAAATSTVTAPVTAPPAAPEPVTAPAAQEAPVRYQWQRWHWGVPGHLSLDQRGVVSRTRWHSTIHWRNKCRCWGTLTCKNFFLKEFEEYRKGKLWKNLEWWVFFSLRNGLEWRWIKRLEPMMAACSVCATSLVRIAMGFLLKQPNWKLLELEIGTNEVGHSWHYHFSEEFAD